MWPLYLAVAVVGYLLGSLPTGYLVGRTRGIDIRQHGSGNIGATNVVRVLGKKPGYLVFFCDALKGFAAVQATGFLRHGGLHSPYPPLSPEAYAWHGSVLGIVAALACILGHNFPVWLRFRGGKGVATTIGVLLGLMPLSLLIVTPIWVIAFYVWRYVSLASMLAAAALPVTILGLRASGQIRPGAFEPMLCFALAAAGLVVWRHRANIRRLLDGTEPRFARKSKLAPIIESPPSATLETDPQ